MYVVLFEKVNWEKMNLFVFVGWRSSDIEECVGGAWVIIVCENAEHNIGKAKNAPRYCMVTEPCYYSNWNSEETKEKLIQIIWINATYYVIN